MELLSDECLHLILLYLPLQDRVSVGQVSRRLRAAAKDMSLWGNEEARFLPGCNLHATRRILLFAPLLHHVELHHLWGRVPQPVRSALTTTTCRVYHLTVHLAWPLFAVTASFLRTQRDHLQELTLYPCFSSLCRDFHSLTADVLSAVDSSRIRRLSVSSCVEQTVCNEETPFSWSQLDSLRELRLRDRDLWTMRPLFGPRSVSGLISRNKLSLRVVQVEHRLCRELAECSGLQEVRVGVDGELRRLSGLKGSLEVVTAVWKRSFQLGIGYFSKILADSPLPGHLSQLKVEIDNESASFDGRLLPFVRNCGQWITGLALIGLTVSDEEFVESLMYLPRLQELSVELWEEDEPAPAPAALSVGKLRGWTRAAAPALRSLVLWAAPCACPSPSLGEPQCVWAAAVQALEQSRPYLRVYFRKDVGCVALKQRVREQPDPWHI